MHPQQCLGCADSMSEPSIAPNKCSRNPSLILNVTECRQCFWESLARHKKRYEKLHLHEFQKQRARKPPALLSLQRQQRCQWSRKLFVVCITSCSWLHNSWTQTSVQSAWCGPATKTGKHFSHSCMWKAFHQHRRAQKCSLYLQVWLWTGFFLLLPTVILTAEMTTVGRHLRITKQVSDSLESSRPRHHTGKTRTCHTCTSNIRRMLFQNTEESEDIPV